MRLHIDNKDFKRKPKGAEIGGIKSRLTDRFSVQDIDALGAASYLYLGRTIQPAVTPFSEKSKAAGHKGTVADDFEEQTLFMIDVDNKRTDIPRETPVNASKALSGRNLSVSFIYHTFSSTEEHEKFRIAVVSDEPFTDKNERDLVQTALIRLFPQADTDCVNADRLYFGTNKGMIEELCNYDSVCKKADLLALADELLGDAAGPETVKPFSGKKKDTVPAHDPNNNEVIPEGSREQTMFAEGTRIITRYGDTEEARTKFNAFLSRLEVIPGEDDPPLKKADYVWNRIQSHYHTVTEKRDAYEPPDEYNASPDLMPTDFTDVGQAAVLAKEYGNIMRYSKGTKWIVYNDRVWEESDIKAQGLTQELTGRQLKEARDMLKKARDASDRAAEGDNDIAKEKAKDAEKYAEGYRSFVLGRRKTGNVTATQTAAIPALEISVNELDANPFYLNTPGGTVDLKTGELHPHDPKDYCTKITSVSPSAAGADLWSACVDRVSCGDKALAEYHQITAGMCAVLKVYQENLIIAFGTGLNGKSTFYNTIARVMGDYAGNLSAETLTVNCRKNKSPEYAELRGKGVVIAAELEEGTRLDTAIVKKLCSTDKIYAEKKYKDPFAFTPSHTVVLFTNHLPSVGTSDSGTWRRLIVVPFNAVIEGADDVKNYADYLYENASGAVLSWIIEGAKKFISAGFMIESPECVKQAIEEYRQENDWVKNFLDECCEFDSRYREKSGELYSMYKDYCDDTGAYRRRQPDFNKAVEGAGYKRTGNTKGYFFHGLRGKSVALR